MCALLLRPEAALPDVEELLTQAIDEVEEVTEEKDGGLIAATTHMCLSLSLSLLVSDLLDQVLIARHKDLRVVHKTRLER